MEHTPIILDLFSFHEVFFDEEQIETLIETGEMKSLSVTTKSGMPAGLKIDLAKEEDFFHLKIAITSHFGTENIDVLNDLENCNEVFLKCWIYICTCDEKRKKIYIDDSPGLYKFESGIILSE